MRPKLDLAICELRRARDVARHNAPLHDLAGDAEQAALCRAVAEQCARAIIRITSKSLQLRSLA